MAYVVLTVAGYVRGNVGCGYALIDRSAISVPVKAGNAAEHSLSMIRTHNTKERLGINSPVAPTPDGCEGIQMEHAHGAREDAGREI